MRSPLSPIDGEVLPSPSCTPVSTTGQRGVGCISPLRAGRPRLLRDASQPPPPLLPPPLPLPPRLPPPPPRRRPRPQQHRTTTPPPPRTKSSRRVRHVRRRGRDVFFFRWGGADGQDAPRVPRPALLPPIAFPPAPGRRRPSALGSRTTPRTADALHPRTAALPHAHYNRVERYTDIRVERYHHPTDDRTARCAPPAAHQHHPGTAERAHGSSSRRCRRTTASSAHALSRGALSPSARPTVLEEQHQRGQHRRRSRPPPLSRLRGAGWARSRGGVSLMIARRAEHSSASLCAVGVRCWAARARRWALLPMLLLILLPPIRMCACYGQRRRECGANHTAIDAKPNPKLGADTRHRTPPRRRRTRSPRLRLPRPL